MLFMSLVVNIMILYRYLNRLKRMVKNKSNIEGSICETYLSFETSHFCSYYFESHVQSMITKVGHLAGTCKSHYLNEK